MKNHKKRKQREEVRKILAAMREELAAQRVAQETKPVRESLHLNELITRARASVVS